MNSNSNVIAISQAIAELDCDEEIKKCLQALFNEELTGTNSINASKNFYVKQVELCAKSWTPKGSAVK